MKNKEQFMTSIKQTIRMRKTVGEEKVFKGSKRKH